MPTRRHSPGLPPGSRALGPKSKENVTNCGFLYQALARIVSFEHEISMNRSEASVRATWPATANLREQMCQISASELSGPGALPRPPTCPRSPGPRGHGSSRSAIPHLCSPSGSAASTACLAYQSADELLADDAVQAVIVAVPDRLHLPLAGQALRSGRHVLVEKPLAGTAREAEQLAAVAGEVGLVLQVGAMKRYDPGVQHAAEAVRSRIGTVLSATIWYRVMSALRPPTEATLFPALVVDEAVREHEAAFKADRSSYLLTTHGAHVLDGMRFLLGDPTRVSAQLAHSGRDYTWHGLAGLADGGLAHFEITANVHAEWSEGADIYGDKGHVRLRTHFPFALRASDVEVYDEARSVSERPVFPDSNAYELQIEAFAAAVTTGAAATPDAQDGLAAVRLIDAVAESVAKDGSWVKP